MLQLQTKMFRAMNRQPQSLRTPVTTPSKKTKNRGNMHAEDSEMMRLVQQKRLARAQEQTFRNSSPSQSTQSFPGSSQGASAQPTSFSSKK